MACRLNKEFMICFLLLNFTRLAINCVARPGGQKRRSPRIAFYLHQRVPDIDEFSQGASGKPTELIKYDSPAYKRLSTNLNPGIVFEHRSETSGNTRKMTKKCLDALNKLERLVKQRWPRIRLRVIAAWDQETSHLHDVHSLHYEGRAVDITTSDRDRSKLGLLARLAVEAGFDWVKYVHKYRVHASVREDSKVDTPFMDMGCFRSNSTVRLIDGKTTTLNRLKLGDKVESMNKDGQIIYSEVTMFLDNKPEKKGLTYLIIRTENPRRELYLTKSHLIYFRQKFSSIWNIDFAKLVQKGDFVMAWDNENLVPAKVTSVSFSNERGAIAPLTDEGNIIVDGVLASCYAVLNDHELVDSLFWPAKVMYKHFPTLLNAGKIPQQGVHWYPRLLLLLNKYFSVLT